MVRKVKSQGANVICVIHMRFKDTVLGNQGADYVVEHFFMQGGKAVIDVLINPVKFSLQTAAPEYKGLLEHLSVPVLQAISTGRSMIEGFVGVGSFTAAVKVCNGGGIQLVTEPPSMLTFPFNSNIKIKTYSGAMCELNRESRENRERAHRCNRVRKLQSVTVHFLGWEDAVGR